MKAMKEKKIHEDTIEQIYRLFATRLYAGTSIPIDQNGFIRLDDLEMREDIQAIVNDRWKNLNASNLKESADLEGYHKNFLKLFGFGFKDVDYNQDVESDLKLPSSS